MHLEPPRSDTAPVLRATRVATGAAAAIACAALISACGGSSSSNGSGPATTNLNTARVARSIEGTLLEKRRIHATVVCPQTVPQEAGKTFECIARIPAAKPPHAVTSSPFLVTIQNNRGYVTYVGK